MEYKNFLILIHRDHAGLELSAIPDSGETIRRRFIFYTEEEAIEEIKEEIDLLID